MSNEDIVRDIAALKREMSDMRSEMSQLRRTLIGSYDTPGGYAMRVVQNERDVAQLSNEFLKYQTRRDELVKEFDDRVVALEDWVKAMRNKAVGIVIGLSLGSAGIGAGVATVISNLFGG